MMGSADAVATAHHFVRERLKEIEARGTPACLPACLPTTYYLRYSGSVLRCSVMHLASALSHPPSSSLTQGSQRTACGRWRRRADAGRSVTQRSAAQYDGGGAGDSARSPTPATPLYPGWHPLHPVHPQPVLHIPPRLCPHVCSAPCRRRASEGRPTRSRASYSRPTRRRSRRPSCSTACPICRRACSSPPWGRSPA